jgi:hypothetical protein
MPTNCNVKLIDSLIEAVEKAEKASDLVEDVLELEPARASGHPARRHYTQLGYNHEIDRKAS